MVINLLISSNSCVVISVTFYLVVQCKMLSCTAYCHKHSRISTVCLQLIWLIVACETGVEFSYIFEDFSTYNIYCYISGMDGEFEENNTPLQSKQHMSYDVPQETVGYFLSHTLLK